MGRYKVLIMMQPIFAKQNLDIKDRSFKDKTFIPKNSFIIPIFISQYTTVYA